MRIVILAGGVGGAKLVLGATRAFASADVTVIVNTGDDFRHLGLHVSPDVDTMIYTLSGKSNRELGWGREGETWQFMAALRSLGGEDWFALGDSDLALHVWRTMRLSRGDTLGAITGDVARAWGIAATILPMSDDPVATHVHTVDGILEFQRYFVERRCEPVATGIAFDGADQARPAPGVVAAIESADAILIAPSNPLLSIDPILAVAPIRAALAAARAPRIAVSPIIGGKAVKGPTAKLLAELGRRADNATIAAHYAGLIDGLLVDTADSDEAVGLPTASTATLMVSDDDKARVARAAIAFARATGRR
ncbi:MAG: 2-phospho-L-lactate transferase [Alphaproteobacteria bacterium]|nr:2-phospho-L-lactate transferase [Alphaproteobacteria bacterium]